MKAIFENKFNLTEDQLNMPFIIGETPIGYISEINKENFSVEIFDVFVGFELTDKVISAIYFSEKKQMSYGEVMNNLSI